VRPQTLPVVGGLPPVRGWHGLGQVVQLDERTLASMYFLCRAQGRDTKALERGIEKQTSLFLKMLKK
jgi:hypothetical protein